MRHFCKNTNYLGIKIEVSDKGLLSYDAYSTDSSLSDEDLHFSFCPYCGMELKVPDKQKKRESGFYWIKHVGSWAIADYNSVYDTWFITGSEIDYYDSEFDEILETRLNSPAEQSAQNNVE